MSPQIVQPQAPRSAALPAHPSGWTIATVVRHAREVEVVKQAEDAWVALLLTGAGRMIGYPAGASAFFRFLDEWRRSGAFEGLAFICG